MNEFIFLVLYIFMAAAAILVKFSKTSRSFFEPNSEENNEPEYDPFLKLSKKLKLPVKKIKKNKVISGRYKGYSIKISSVENKFTGFETQYKG
jgi:hypothetical protein